MESVTAVWRCAFPIRDLYSRCLMYIFIVTFTMPFTKHNAYGLEYGHKIWMQSTNLGAPEGWLDRKVPCPGQKIILVPLSLLSPDKGKSKNPRAKSFVLGRPGTKSLT